MTGAANTQAQIAQYIASLQAGNVPGAIDFGQNLANTQAGITNTNTTAQEALQAAQLANLKPFEASSGIVFNPANNNSNLAFTKAGGGVGGGVDINKLASIIASMNGNSKRQPMNNINQFVQ